MASINKVILIGNVGKDPEIRYVDTETPVATFSLATSDRSYTTRDGKTVPEHTEWHSIVAWRGLAKVVERFVHKGTALYIEGKLRGRRWTDQQGVQHSVTEIVADELEVLGKREPNGASASNAQDNANREDGEPF